LPVYLYKGVDVRSGALRKGRVEAENVKAAKTKLRKTEKILASDLKEETSDEKLQKTGGFLSFGGKVGQKELAVMTRQFATLQSAHVPLDESLVALTGQVENKVLQNTLSRIKDLVSEGQGLAEAMKNYPAVFDKLYVNMVMAGETSGTLGLVLVRLADFLEYQIKVRGQIFSAMVYPVVMLCASGGIIIYLFVSVVPKLQKIFKSLRVDLPWYTEALINVSEFIQEKWFLIIFFVWIFYFVFNRWTKSSSGKRKFHQFLLKTPVYGAVLLRMNVSTFTKTLSTLLQSGVPIIQALEITRNIIGNLVIAEVVEKAKIAVQEGENLGEVIERSKQFPSLVSHMIRTGEKTGQLEEMLGHVASAYDTEVQQKVDSMISLIEPMMIIVMAILIGGVVIAMLVPMISVMSSVR